MTEPTDLIEYLLPYPDHVQHLMIDGRMKLLRMLSPIVEMHYDATTAVCAGFSTTGDLKGLFVNLAAFAHHVTLVFAYGALLDDPEKRLKGEGKQVRHMRLLNLEMLDDPYILGMIENARANAPLPIDPITTRIVTKVYAGPKRRPS